MGGTVCPNAGRARKNSAARMAFRGRLCNKCATTAWGVALDKSEGVVKRHFFSSML